MKKLILGLILAGMFSAQSFADTFYFWRYREHATDCTALTDGKDKDLCFEIDSEAFYKCEPTAGDCSGSEWKHITGLLPSNPTACTSGQFVTDIAQDGTLTCGTPSGSGTVTSVGLSLPAQFTVTNSPVTSSGTLTGSWANQLQNLIFASPNGETGPPTFRSLVSSDIPDLSSVYAAVSHNHSGTYQPADSDLTSVAGLSTAGIVKRTDSTTYSTVTDNSSNWNTAYGWGNHASAGYLTGVNWGDIEGLVTAQTDLVNWADNTYLKSVASDSDWTTHGSYPSACSSGQYVTAIGDTLTCNTPAGSGDMTKAVYDTDADNLVDIAEAMSASGINWTDFMTPDSSINWDDMVPLNETDPLWTAWNGSDGINWSALPAILSDGINWTDVEWADMVGYPAACSAGEYVTAIGDTLTCAAPAGSGDVTGVGDCASGACGDGSSDGGTYYRLYDGDSHYLQLGGVDIAANKVINFGDMTDEAICQYESTGTILSCDVVQDGSGACASGSICTGGHTHGSTEITEADPSVDTDDEIIAIINASPSTTIKHEAGGLEADVSAYAGLLHITGGATSAKTIGIAQNNITQVSAADAADDDFARFTATGLEGRSAAETLGDIGAEAADANIIKSGEIDTSAELFAILTDETGSASGSPLAVFNVNPTLTGVTLAGILADNDDVVIEIDANNDGSNSLSITDGASTEVLNVAENGDLKFDGDLTVEGGDITLGTSKIFSGGDTTSLNLIDAIDATTETTLEAAIDTLGSLAEGGLADSTVISADIKDGTIAGGDLASNIAITSTGAQDYGGATSFEIPNAASPTIDAAGEIAVDTTSDHIEYYGGAKRVIGYQKQFCFTLETPVDADDNIPIYFPREPITVTDVYCEVDGGTSVAMTLSDGTNALEAITCDADGAEDDGSIANGTFTANERMEIDLASTSGTNTFLAVCVTYVLTED